MNDNERWFRMVVLDRFRCKDCGFIRDYVAGSKEDKSCPACGNKQVSYQSSCVEHREETE
jgi:rubrerythrin